MFIPLAGQRQLHDISFTDALLSWLCLPVTILLTSKFAFRIINRIWMNLHIVLTLGFANIRVIWKKTHENCIYDSDPVYL